MALRDTELQLDKILDHRGLKRRQLNVKCQDIETTQIAERIVDWETLAPYLGLDDRHRKAIRINNSTHELRKKAMLDKWVHDNADEATYLYLIKCCLEAGDRQLCGEICDIFAEQSRKRSAEEGYSDKAKRKKPRREEFDDTDTGSSERYNQDKNDKHLKRIQTWKKLPADDQLNKTPESGIDPYCLHHVPFGYCIIINNKKFKGSKKKYREGSSEDVKKLKEQFSERGFVPQIFQNLTKAEMLGVMQDLVQFCDQDKGKVSCIVVVLMSHGDCQRWKDIGSSDREEGDVDSGGEDSGDEDDCDENGSDEDSGSEDNDDDDERADRDALSGQGMILSSDMKRVKVDKILQIFSKAKSLAGIPKLFILHACRGRKKDSGLEVQEDVHVSKKAIPSMADFLLAYPTPLSFVSYRDIVKGANFIQQLCATLADEKFDKEDFHTILTEVAYRIAEKKKNKETKEMPNFTSFLRHKLILPPIEQ